MVSVSPVSDFLSDLFIALVTPFIFLRHKYTPLLYYASLKGAYTALKPYVLGQVVRY